MREILYTENQIYSSDLLKVIKYNDSSYKIIQFKNKVRKKGFEKDKKDIELDFEESNKQDKEKTEESIRISMSRTKRIIREYALCNDFDYFVTLTFNRKWTNAREIEELKKRIGQTFNNYKKRVNSNFKYIIVPELHSDGINYHFHGLISGIKDIKEFKANSKGVMRYNWIMWENKFGFNSIEKIRDRNKVSNYITKYITKELITTKYKQRYMCSKGLKKSETIMSIENYNAIIPFDYENDYVRVKNINSYDQLFQYINYISNTK